MAFFTKTFHRSVYPSLEPSQFDFSGKTVLVVGISSGIGQSIASSFIKARADTIVAVGRNEKAMLEAADKLRSEPEAAKAKILTAQCDATDSASVTKLWQTLQDEGVEVDILALVLADLTMGSVVGEGAVKKIGRALEVNVMGSLALVDRFTQQAKGRAKTILNISSAVIHVHMPNLSPYNISKIAFATAMQDLSYDFPEEELRVVNVHPGSVFSEAARKNGMTEDSLPWNDAHLPGAFCVWAASPKTAFLHGRFVWSNWDVDEIEGMEAKFKEDVGFLRIGLQGIPSVTMENAFSPKN